MEIIVLFLAFLLVVALGWLALIEFRYQRLARSYRALMSGGGGADLEAVLLDYIGRMGRIEQGTNTLHQRVQMLEAKQPLQVQHLGVVRFNPFSDKGGDQSFVVAWLDDHTDGVVLSCLHSRVGLRLYAKPVVGGQSTYTLTTEEKEAIARAMKPRS